MNTSDILAIKGSLVHTTTGDVSLQAVVETLVRHNCGSLVVVENGQPDRMVGIITERDIMRACAKGNPLSETCVEEVMTRDVVRGYAAQSLEETMGLMTDRRIRHLPIIEGDRLAGMISIGDVVKIQHDRLSAENHQLKSYIHDSGIIS